MFITKFSVEIFHASYIVGLNIILLEYEEDPLAGIHNCGFKKSIGLV